MVLPKVTAEPTAGRNSGLIEIAAPDADKSMTRQVTLVPFGRIKRAIGLRGVKRPLAAVLPAD